MSFNYKITMSCEEYYNLKKGKIKESIKGLSKSPKVAIVQISNNIASNVYVRNKIKDFEETGIEYEFVHRDETVSMEELSARITELNNDESVTGIFIQLPLPKHLDVKVLQNLISPSKDIDGFRKDSLYYPCTPKGIVDWLDYNNVPIEGTNITILGRSEIVGKPLVNMLINRGATVACCNSHTKNLEPYVFLADIVISAIGKPKYLNDDYFSYDQIIIDVGINRDENGKLCGDVNKEEIENKNNKLRNMYITPVPKGVGLLTRIALLENIIQSAQIKN
mgnify:CR=1 FL=1